MQMIADPPTILIADNDPLTLKTLTNYFKKKGNNVIPAPNLQATEAVLKLSLNQLDAAILDGRLEFEADDKDRSGWELAKKTLAEETERPIPFFIHSRVSPHESHAKQSEALVNLFEVPKSKGVE